MTTLFESVKNSAVVRVSHDGDCVVVETVFEGVLHEARLPIPQAVECAIAILAANIGHVGHVAEQLDDLTAAAIGQGFLFPVARRSVERQAAGPMPEAN
jgi:hypothetical protein